MSIESAIATELRTDATLSGLSTGVYPHVAPLSASYPFITYFIQSSETEDYLDKSTTDLTMTDATMDISVYSDSLTQRVDITTRIKTILHGFTGTIGTESLNIHRSILQSLSTFSESDLTGTDEQIYRASLTFTFIYDWS